METILLIAVVGTLMIVSFFVGAKVGQKVSNNEPIELPKINPMEIYKEHKEKKEFNEEMDALEKSLENINNYGSEKPQLKI
jgi:hypothetical protein